MMIQSITEKPKEKVDRSQAGPHYRCARRLTIISRSRKRQLLVNITDDGQIIEANQLIREYFGPAHEAEKRIFAEALGDAPSGTVVQISKSDGFKRK
jgi:hypothetical protein